MINIIIVDDEELSLNAMARFITHIRKDTNISGLFKNVHDAIEFLKDNPVDIVISDIRMPTASGIDLAKYIRENFPSIRVVFASAYSDFEYAQQAISLGVVQYLVKPVDVNELSSMLEKLITDINKEREGLLKKQKEEDNYNNLLLWAKTDMYVDLLAGLLSDDTEISKRAMHIGLSQEAQKTCHAVVMVRCKEMLPPDYSKDEYYQMVSDLFRDFKGIDDFIVLSKKESDVTLVLRFSPHFVLETAKLHLKNECSRVLGASSGNSALELVTETAFFCSSLVELTGYKDAVNNSLLLQMKFRDLASSIFAGEHTKVKDIFNSILCYAYTLNLEQSKKLMLELFTNLQKNFELSDMNTEILFNEQSIMHCNDIKKLSETVEQVLEKIISFRKLSSVGLEALTIEKAKDYIKSHYMYDLTLEEIAGQVNLSSFYFSKFFKSETGETLTEYITSVRISKAIQMFKERKYKLYEISEKCGYKSRKYFSHSFKQFTGYTPSEYQRIININTEE
ncbi:MAG: response regulator [Clostridia bacterium]|nr:response regulator [Clostridia bacterium]